MINEANTQTFRRVRDLIRPHDERPMRATHNPERRRHPRYSRCLLGTMDAPNAQVSIACVDVSEGGAQVVTPGTPPISKGDRVTVSLDHHTGNFQDQFTVVQTNVINSGTAIHLAL